MYRTLNVPWGTIRMRNWGAPYHEAETRLLCVNGILSGINQWSPIANELLKQKNMAVIGYDMPGCGKSTIPDLYMSMPNLWGFSIYCVMKELDWHNAHICGHSNGGQLASIFALLFPEMVQSLTNIDGSFHFRVEPSSAAAIARDEIESSLKRYKQQKPNTTIVRSYSQFVDDFKQRCNAQEHPEVNWDDVADVWLTDLIEERADGMFEQTFSHILKNSTTPTWMMGEDDFRRLARRVEFPVNYVRGRDWENMFALVPPPFDVDVKYNNDTYKVVKKYAVRNSVPFTDTRLDGSHFLHLTHQKEISEILLETIKLTE